MDEQAKKKHKKLVFWIVFPICWTLLSAVIIFYMDFANGPLIWFILELLVLVGLFVARVLMANKKKRYKLLTWGVFVLLTVAILSFDQPKHIRKSAAYYANPVLIEKPLTVSGGKVQGFYSEDKKVEIYAGIPYAKAERWKEPVEADKWSGVRDGTYFGPMAMQGGPYPQVIVAENLYLEGKWKPNYLETPIQEKEEGGLYLNIWKPNTTETNLPILMFIHGGSLKNGSGAFEDYNGEAMAHKGVIMITIQYRLGVFGYFAHPDLKKESKNHTTGNYGLLDQIAALNWINKNAANFGGDKNNITIAGESAGSSSVSALCTSPLAAGKFKRAIGESSSLVIQRPHHTYRSLKDAYSVGKSIMKEFRCSSIDELRKVPAAKLVRTKFKNEEMTCDGYALTKDPYQVYLEGNNNEEFLLNGYNVKEADPFVMIQYLLSPTNKANIKGRLELVFGEKYAEKIYKLYEKKIEKNAVEAINEIVSVAYFMFPHDSWTKMALSSPKTSTVYRYQFTKENGYMGTIHSGEMVYAYGNIDKQGKLSDYDESDRKLEKIMLNYWANFVKTGNPNGAGLPTWDEYTTMGDGVMELGTNVGKIPDKYTKLYKILYEYDNEKVTA